METKKIFLLLIILIFLIFIRLIGRYVHRFIEFMFNQKSKWYKKSIEKPRLLFHILALILFILSFVPLWGYERVEFMNWNDMIRLSASFILFAIGAFFSLFSWSSKFKYRFVPKVESKIRNRNTLKIRTDLDKDAIFEKYLSETYISNDSFDDFKRFIHGEEIKNRIIWTNEAHKSGQVMYKSLFGLLHEVIEGGFHHKDKKRSVYEKYVADHFIIERGEFEKNIKYRYCEWIKAINKAE